MTPSRKLSENLELSSSSKANVVMEQNPLKKTELMSEKGADVKLNFKMKRVFVVLLAVIGFGLSANAQTNDCTTGKYNSVGTAFRERTPYTAIVSSAQANYGYKISFKSYDAEQGSIYCDVKFTNLNGEEEKWNGTGDWNTIKAKPGTTIYARFYNSTNIQGILIEYEVCKKTL